MRVRNVIEKEITYLTVDLIYLKKEGKDCEKSNSMYAYVFAGNYAVIWEDRTYMPFCVVSKNDCGEQIGYVDGDVDNRISEYKGYASEEWLVSWLPMDGGAILLKEQSVVDIPEGLEAEY